MFDVARVAALLFALSSCRRPRFVVGMLCAVILAALLGWEIGAPLARHSVGAGGFGSAFAFSFLGPSQITPRPVITAAETLVASGAARLAFARARPLRPEGETARAWDAAALRFLFVAVMNACLVVFDLLLGALTRGV